jgi:hypothetical protein
MLFDGVNESVEIPSHAGINFDSTDAFSMTVWVKCPNYATGGNNWVFSKRDPVATFKGYATFFSGGDFYVYLASSVGSIALVRTSGVSFTNNNWYNVGFTYTGGLSWTNITIYVNGVAVSKVLAGGTGVLNSSLSSTYPLYLSYDLLSPDYINAYIGVIRSWRTLLSGADMLADYNGGSTLQDPVQPLDMTFEFGAGREALYGTNWVFPIGIINPTAYSINMEFADRTTDIP